MGIFDKIASNVTSAANSVTEAAKQASGLASDAVSGIKDSKIWSDISDSTAKAWSGTVASADELARWAETVPETIHTYADRFDADEMWQKISDTAAKVGQEMIIMVLTMYYTIEDAIKKIDLKSPENGNKE